MSGVTINNGAAAHFGITLHWTDGRVTEYLASRYELDKEKRELKIWGSQFVLGRHIPTDRDCWIFETSKLTQMEFDQ